jgi:hypothetical protein
MKVRFLRLRAFCFEMSCFTILCNDEAVNHILFNNSSNMYWSFVSNSFDSFALNDDSWYWRLVLITNQLRFLKKKFPKVATFVMFQSRINDRIGTLPLEQFKCIQYGFPFEGRDVASKILCPANYYLNVYESHSLRGKLSSYTNYNKKDWIIQVV